jgi:hypothetical protein
VVERRARHPGVEVSGTMICSPRERGMKFIRAAGDGRMSPELDEHDDHEHPITPAEGHFTDLFAAAKKPPAWVIENLIPEGLTVIVGPPKDAFKSTITTALAAMVSRCKCTALPVEWKPKQTGVVMLFSYEADAGELREIMEDGLGVKAPADERILVADQPDTFQLDDPGAVEEMLAWLHNRKPKLVVLDPLANFHAIDEKDSIAMIKILSPLRRWAKETNSAFVIVHHTRKLPEDRNYRADDVRGSSAIFGLCDGILVITPGKQKYELIIDAKFKRGSAGWVKTIMLGAWDRRGVQGGEILQAIDRSVLGSIHHGYNTRKMLLLHSRLAEKTLDERLNFLLRNGYVKQKRDKYKIVKGKDT